LHGLNFASSGFFMTSFLSKILFLLFIISCYSLSLKSQAPSIYWQKSFGGSENEGRALVRCTSDKGFIMGGFGKSTNGDFTDGNAGAYDMLMLKLDSCGNRQWAKTFGASSNDLIYGLSEAPDHGYLFAGATFSSSMPGFHGGQHDAILLKTDAAGNIQWTKLLGGSRLEVLANMIFLPDTSCVVAG
jgi:hypothetical protein